MTITYTWKIDMLHTKDVDNVIGAITDIHWSKHALTDTGISARHPGVSKFNIEMTKTLAENGNFTLLNELTENQVLVWIQNSLTDKDKEFIDLQLARSIEEQVNRVIVDSITYDKLPWLSQ